MFTYVHLCFFTKYRLIFCMFNFLMSCIGLTTNSPTSLLDFIRRRVGVGELVRRRVDWLPSAMYVAMFYLLECVICIKVF